MSNNILITPGSASIQFSGSAVSNDTIRLQVEPLGGVAFYGNSGSLFSITDQLSGSLMSVNDISGLPILEVFSDDRVVMGTYNQNALVVTGSNVGIGTANPTAKLFVEGDAIITGRLTAEEFHTEFVSSSVIYRSGSTKFGDSADDRHSFTGSVLVIGAVSASSVTGSFLGTVTGQASSVANAVTFNNGGAGAASGTTYNGSAAVTVSHNTIGAVPTGRTLTITTNNGITGGAAAVDLSANRAWTFGLTGQALAFHNLATNGIVVRTAADTITARSLAAGTGISITNADGVSGNPTISNTGVTSVSGTGTVSGLTLSGTVTTTGNITLGGTLAVTPSNFASQTANTFLAAPNGSAGVPTFRTIVAADIPTLNQNTTGQAGSVANAVTFNNGGSGAASGTTYNGSAARTISHNTIGALALTGGTITGNLTITPTAYVVVNKPSPATYQTTALFGTTGGGIFITSDNAIISKGAYYSGSWIATATAGGLIDFTANSNNPSIATFSGATIGQAAGFSTSQIIVHAGNVGTYATTGVTAGNGLTGGGTVGGLTLNVGAGDGISVTADAVAVDASVVRTSGNQTIGGIKTFSSNVVIDKAAQAAGANSYHLELYAPDSGTSQEISMRFHQGNRFYHQIRARAGFFRFTQGNDDTLVDVYANTFVGALSGNASTATSATTANNLKSNATTGVMQIVGPAAAETRVMTIPNANFTVARTDAAQTFTGTQTFARIVTTGLYGPGGTGNIPIWQYDAGNPGYGIVYVEGTPDDSIRIDVSSNALTGTPDVLISPNAMQINGNTVWHAGNDGTTSGLDADLLDGYHLDGATSVATRIFNNKGQTHGTYTNFNTVMTPGPNYLQGGTNGPTGTAGHQWYGIMFGLGTDYGTSTGTAGHYASQLYYARAAQGGDQYLWARDMENGAWGSWRKLYAGYADSAGAVTNGVYTTGDQTIAGNKTFSNVVYLANTSAVATSDHTRILYPGGARYVTTASAVTGAIKIKLPVLGSAMMMTATVKIYEYSTNKSFEVVFGGHRDSANWYNEFAYQNGAESRDDITVRFGIDGTTNCVWIGETNTVWSYPQVFVTDVQLGYTGYSASWHTGWAITFETAFDTINRTQVARRKLSSANYSSYALPLSGGTMSGDVTVTRIRGVNSLILNTFTTVNPSSNVYLYSQPNDRDAWIFLDSADVGSNWGIYHRQIDSAVSGLPANSIGFIGGGNSGLRAYISLADGSANFAGALTQAGNQVVHAGNVGSYATTGVTAGAGLTGGGGVGSLTLNVGAGSGISVAADTVAVDSTVIRTTGGQTISGALTVNGNLAGTYTMAASRTTFNVGGNASTYYPVLFAIGAGATAYQYCSFIIERGGYDDPGYSGIGFSNMHAKFSMAASGWGFGSDYIAMDHYKATYNAIAKWTQQSQSSEFIIWLRGATQYNLLNIVGNTTLVNGNGSGTSITRSQTSGGSSWTATYDPTGTVEPYATRTRFNDGSVWQEGSLTVAAGDRDFEVAGSGNVSFYGNEINAGSGGGTGNLYLGNRRTTQVYVRGSNIVLGADNFNNYAPTLVNGVGASGTWPINITGNAASITNQANSATITAATAATADRIVLRDSNGDTFVRYGFASYFNMSHGVSGATTDTVFYSSTDDYIRKNNATGFRASLNVPTRTGGDASGTWSININGSAGSVAWSSISGQRTLGRDNAGLRGDAGARSGFFETSSPTNYYAGASSWQHLIEARHTNDGNNYAMQLAGSFFDQALWFRKTNDSATTAWRRVVTNDTDTLWGINISGQAGALAGGLFTTNNGQDFLGRGKRCIVATTTNMILNYAADFTNVEIQSALNVTGVATFPASVSVGGGSPIGILHVGSTANYTTNAVYGFLGSGGAGTAGGFSQTLAVAISTTFSGRIITGEFDAFSDSRLKDVIGDIEYDESVALIKGINPVKYTWKNKVDTGMKVGFIAQDVVRAGHGHLIGLVPSDDLEEHIDDDGFVSPAKNQFVLAYEQIIPYHNKALSHMLDEMYMLREQIKVLQEEILNLKNNK